MLSEAAQDYMKQIYLLERRDGKASTSALAEAMGVSAASAYDPDGWDTSAEANYRKAVRLVARTPTLIAAYHRLRSGRPVVEPNEKLPHAANFLYMLSGEEPVILAFS